jgi:hypothetical protein
MKGQERWTEKTQKTLVYSLNAFQIHSTYTRADAVFFSVYYDRYHVLLKRLLKTAKQIIEMTTNQAIFSCQRPLDKTEKINPKPLAKPRPEYYQALDFVNGLYAEYLSGLATKF